LDRVQRVILAGILSASALTWVVSSTQQDNMMNTMAFGSVTLSPITISLFTTIWTIGMAAMMFPAISPMVLLYNRLIENSGKSNQSTSVVVDGQHGPSISSKGAKSILFVGSYLVVWALTGIAIFLGWSVLMDRLMAMSVTQTSQNLNYVYSSILIISGVYQFSPLKSKCLGYCESPLSFFMRRWKEGNSGALKMGLYHGVYCLGCCWPYFLLMVALGWMNLLWMGLFAGIIFGEKIWSRGIWVARAAGVGLAITGLLAISGLAGAILPIQSSMDMHTNSGMGENGDSQPQMPNQQTSANTTLMQNSSSVSGQPMNMN
jgi:predicted metal-binding membrane protein